MPRSERWSDEQWKQFAKKVWELRKLPENKDRVYWGPIYFEAQKIFHPDLQKGKSYFSTLSKIVKDRLEPYFKQFENEDLVNERVSSRPIDEVKQINGVDYEKLTQMVVARLRKDVLEHLEIMIKVELDERLKGVENLSKEMPHWITKSGSKQETHKVRIALFGIEEKNRNTSRFNYLKHCLDLRIFEGNDPHKAKHSADLAELCLIAANSDILTKTVIDEVKKSTTKTVFTSGGLSAIDAALQTFCQSKGLRFSVPEHPSHQY